MVNAIQLGNQRIRTVGTQIQTTPVRYTSVYGYLIADVSSGTTVSVNSVPQWVENFKTIGVWIAIGVGTANCEIRKVSDITASSIVTVTSAINKAHLEDDPILFLDSPIINVKYFGAVGDGGTTDDTTEIQSACNEIQYCGSADGATVLFPSGVYKISSAISLTSLTTIRGESRRFTRIFQTNGNVNILEMIGTVGSPKSGLCVENIGLDYSVDLTVAGSAVRLDYVDYAYLRDVQLGLDLGWGFSGFYSVGYGLNATNCKRVQVSSCSTRHTYWYGILLQNCEYSQVSDCIFEVGRIAHVRVNTCSYTTITGNVLNGSLTNGLELRTVSHLTAFGNQTQGNASSGISVGAGCNNLTVAGNQGSEASKVSDITISTKGFLADQDVRFLTTNFWQNVGGCSLVALNGVPTWSMPPPVTDMIIGTFYAFPSNHGVDVPVRLLLYYVQDGAGVGDVSFLLSWSQAGNMEGYLTRFGSINITSPVPGTNMYLKVLDVGANAPTTGVPYAPTGGDSSRFFLRRLSVGSGGADTFAGNIWILGLELRPAFAYGA